MIKFLFLELPIWLVKELNGDNAVKVNLPKGYNQLYSEILQADADCVNLHKLGPNFYLTGKHLTGMNLPESEDIARIMLDTFAQRFHRIVNFALSGTSSSTSKTSNSISKINSMIKSNTFNKLLKEGRGGSTSIKDETINDLNEFVARLDEWELELLDTGRKIVTEIRRWENRDSTKIRPNEMVVNLKKRKVLLEQQQRLSQNSTLNGTSSSR
ncbi:DNA replication complex GINS protein PSF3-like protein [Sarcoptes scabiei]|uniref:DNA replication complex GINS protein PSF3 n=1 Tax=Sarcoptes scabiei TaxID=52283 RepID=A0A132AIK1_SARSC|nr:DNA replication complex GINS protein PSF3-like protein [Sarcoptes scabiei]